MKAINIVLSCVVLFIGLCVTFPARAQQQESKDQILFERIISVYARIPSELAKDAFVQEVDKADRQSTKKRCA